MFDLNKELLVAVESKDPPFTFYGKYKGTISDHLIIKGTHGDYTGKIVYIPHKRIQYMVEL